jgi:hypothetical protein
LAHEKWLALSLCFAKRKVFGLLPIFSLLWRPYSVAAATRLLLFWFAGDTPATTEGTLQGRAALAQKGSRQR